MFARHRVVSLAVVITLVAPAYAAVESTEVLAGVQAYRDLEYERAIDLLHKALRQTLTREEKVVALKTLALAHVAVDKSELAIRDFAALLRVDESFELDRTSSPRERAAFEEAKARFATGQSESGRGRDLPALRPEVIPPKPKPGQPVKLSVLYPGGMVEKLNLFYRTRGLGIYIRQVTGGDANGRFELTVPGNRIEAPGLEYYLVGLDDTGASVAKAGSLLRPLTINIAAIPKPVYKKGWFWGIMIGIAVAGAAAGTAVYLTRSTISPSSPGSVTIAPY
jgi:hypothetical protein